MAKMKIYFGDSNVGYEKGDIVTTDGKQYFIITSTPWSKWRKFKRKWLGDTSYDYTAKTTK